MRKDIVTRAMHLLALAAVAASAPVCAEEGLERSYQDLRSGLSTAQEQLGRSAGDFDKKLAAEAPARARLAESAGLPGHYYPGSIDNPPPVDCGFGRRLTYWGVDQWTCTTEHDKNATAKTVRGLPGHYYPGTIDNPPDVDCGIGRQLTYWGLDQWTCTTEGGHDRNARTQSIIGVPGRYYPGAIDNPPDVDCGVTRRLVYVGNDQWACYVEGGHDRNASANAIRGLPGHYYPGAIDNPPDVDCGFGRRLTYWGVDQWICIPEHDKNADAGHGRD